MKRSYASAATAKLIAGLYALGRIELAHRCRVERVKSPERIRTHAQTEQNGAYGAGS
jgi:hypothetical protein